tara:strand:+ start:14617 stop:15138 length:522 start_codon:yes stop_codon:yes gene_type:complete
MVIWLTGISGSGKTTLANCIIKKLRIKYPQSILVDGDEIRELFGNDLGYSLKDRLVQIERIQKVVKFLEKQGFIVVTSALYSSDSITALNRKIFRNYFEVYLKASIELVSSQDIKKIYHNAKLGKEKNVVGLDIKWNEPKFPDLTFSRDKGFTVEAASDYIIENINKEYLYNE